MGHFFGDHPDVSDLDCPKIDGEDGRTDTEEGCKGVTDSRRSPFPSTMDVEVEIVLRLFYDLPNYDLIVYSSTFRPFFSSSFSFSFHF